MVDNSTILRRLEEADDLMAHEVAGWFESGRPRPLSSTPADVTVNEAKHVWRVRQESNAASGRALRGAEAFLRKLGRLQPQKKLQQLVFQDQATLGNLFFEKTNGQFVGAIMVQRKPTIPR